MSYAYNHWVLIIFTVNIITTIDYKVNNLYTIYDNTLVYKRIQLLL